MHPPRWAILIAAVVLTAGCATNDTVTSAPPSFPPNLASANAAITNRPQPSGSSASASPTATEQHMTLTIAAVPLRLSAAVSRGVAFADSDSLLLAGGLTDSGTTGAIWRIQIANHLVVRDGDLAKAVHDAGGALVAGSPMVFGGGNLAPEDVVQALQPGVGIVGRLPRPRADLVAIDANGAAFIVGGGTPTRLDRSVLSTTDGSHYQTVASLVNGARYPAVAVVGDKIIVVGGTDGLHDLTEIQAVDLATGSVRVLGHLPRGLSHAAAMVVGDHLLVAGGRSAGVAQNSVWEIDPATGTVTLAGRLPNGLSDAAAVVVGGFGYLLGGERSSVLDSIVSLGYG